MAKARRPVASEQRVTVYRSKATGRFVSRLTKQGKVRKNVARSQTLYQREPSGRVRRGVETGRVSVKRATVIDTGDQAGMIFNALARTNALTMRARAFTIAVNGLDRGKHRRLVLSVGADPKSPLGVGMVGHIMHRLRQHGLRTQYAERVVPKAYWEKVARRARKARKAGRVPFTREAWRKLRPLSKVTITVKARR